MKGHIRFAVLMAATLVLAACGTTKMAVKPGATDKVQTIALIRVSEPDTYVAQDFGNPGMMFGAVGGAVAGAASADAAKSVHQTVVDANYAAGDHFTSLLKEKLSAAGYQVNLVSVTREKKHKLLENYDSVDTTGADAILDIVIESIGYATEHPMFSPHWRPAAQVKVVLIDARTGETVYSEKFMYGYHNPLMSGTDIEAPENYHFQSSEELFSNSAQLVSGIQHSVEAVTDQVQSNLQK